MGVTIADITKLRKMTGAGMMDCKNALTQANNDFDEAIKIIREKGKAVAAKRSDREASEGCVLVKVDGNFGAMIALKCETDFVANNADFVALTQSILDAAVANRCKTLDDVKALTIGGSTVADLVTDRSGITGEKMELDGYMTAEGTAVYAYNHQNKNFLCTLAVLNKPGFDEAGHEVTLQIAAMNPIAIDEAHVAQSVKDNEMAVAIEKTKEEQVNKAVENALKKAGFNLYISENEDHLAEGIAKGMITEAQAVEIRRIKDETAKEKAANMQEQMVQNIARGRMAKFFKDVCLLLQEYNKDAKLSVAEYLHKFDKDLTVTDFKRFTLRAE